MKRIFLFPVLLVGMLLGSILSGPRAQSSATPQSLFDTVQSLDTKLFDAYNHCDLTTVSSMVAEDLEFSIQWAADGSRKSSQFVGGREELRGFIDAGDTEGWAHYVLHSGVSGGVEFALGETRWDNGEQYEIGRASCRERV